MVGIISEFRKGAKGLVIFINRITLYAILAILLLFSTLSLILGNPYFDFDHLEGSEEKDCENICDSGKAQNDICQKMSGLHEGNNSIIACNLLSIGLSKNYLMPCEASVLCKESEYFENKIMHNKDFSVMTLFSFIYR